MLAITFGCMGIYEIHLNNILAQTVFDLHLSNCSMVLTQVIKNLKYFYYADVALIFGLACDCMYVHACISAFTYHKACGL